MEDKDRRNYNRLDVSLLFSWQPLTAELEEGMLPALAAADNPFASWFMELRPPLPPNSGENDELNSYYRKFSEYQEIIERKISLLSQIIFQPPMQEFFRQQPLPLSLSATGVSFPAAEPLDAGAQVLLTFFLPYAAQLVRVRANILRSTIRESRDPKQACLIAAQFVDLGQEIEDEIARFIILSERKQLRQARLHHEKNA
ncbi:MAG: PilZ domain-containing protein [Pseudomonadota bacterium]|nr:PilZ domain-containing protein [Pseudomonadota bacterium]